MSDSLVEPRKVESHVILESGSHFGVGGAEHAEFLSADASLRTALMLVLDHTHSSHVLFRVEKTSQNNYSYSEICCKISCRV